LTHSPPPDRLRTFRVPFWLGLAYVAVLGVVASFPARGHVSSVSAQPSPTPATGPGNYTVCGIDNTSDPRTGRCVPVDTTPLPCVQGSHFDAKAGFCMPVAPSAPPAPAVQPQPVDPFANLPGIRTNSNSGQSGNPFFPRDPSQP
jgi:hypothetical protein